MRNVIQNLKTGIGIGVDDEIPNHKKPCLVSVKGNVETVYGTFQSIERAEGFMDDLKALIGMEGSEQDNHD